MDNNHEIETYKDRIQRAIDNIEVFEAQLIKVENLYERYRKDTPLLGKDD
jgi:hypothetical protein